MVPSNDLLEDVRREERRIHHPGHIRTRHSFLISDGLYAVAAYPTAVYQTSHVLLPPRPPASHPVPGLFFHPALELSNGPKALRQFKQLPLMPIQQTRGGKVRLPLNYQLIKEGT